MHKQDELKPIRLCSDVAVFTPVFSTPLWRDQPLALGGPKTFDGTCLLHAQISYGRRGKAVQLPFCSDARATGDRTINDFVGL